MVYCEKEVSHASPHVTWLSLLKAIKISSCFCEFLDLCMYQRVFLKPKKTTDGYIFDCNRECHIVLGVAPWGVK